MTSLTESLSTSKYTPLYENKQNERNILMATTKIDFRTGLLNMNKISSTHFFDAQAC